jgi:hypothetical protein
MVLPVVLLVVAACTDDTTGGAWSAVEAGAPASDGGRDGAAPSGGSGSSGGGTNRDASVGNTAPDATMNAPDAGGSDDGAGGSDGGPATDGASAADQGAAPTCVTAGTELCDDFESGQLDPKKWTLHKSNNDDVVVETGLAHSGQYAVHLKLVAGQTNQAQIIEKLTFPAAYNTFYTRAFLYFSPDIPSGNGYHMGYIYASGNNDLGLVQAGMGSIGPKDFLGYSIYFGPPSHEFGPWASLTVSANRWLCVELFESGVQGVGETRRVWVDDMELTDLETTYDGQAPPQFDTVSLGVWQYDGNTPTLNDMWIDDVRVSSRKIGCGP